MLGLKLSLFALVVPFVRPTLREIYDALCFCIESTHFLRSISVPSFSCILLKCCLKLSSLGHFLSCFGQLSPKHLYSMLRPCDGGIL